jgi:hypothetical protein
VDGVLGQCLGDYRSNTVQVQAWFKKQPETGNDTVQYHCDTKCIWRRKKYVAGTIVIGE